MQKLLRLSRNVFWYLCLPLSLMACAPNEIIVEKPVPVEVVRVERVQVPADMLIIHNPSTIPETLTWSEVAQLWTADRETIAILNAQILGIKSLSNSE